MSGSLSSFSRHNYGPEPTIPPPVMTGKSEWQHTIFFKAQQMPGIIHPRIRESIVCRESAHQTVPSRRPNGMHDVRSALRNWATPVQDSLRARRRGILTARPTEGLEYIRSDNPQWPASFFSFQAQSSPPCTEHTRWM